MNAISKTVAVEMRNELQRYEPQFARALPPHVPPQRFLRIAETAILNNPRLLNADKRQLLAELVKCAQDGLVPDGREAAIVPTGAGVSYRPMVAGLLKLARNSGEIASIHAEPVYRGEKFSVVLGDDPRIEHERAFDAADNGEWIAVYSVATLKSGEKQRAVMTKAQVLKIRDRSDGYRAFKSGRIKENPWNSDEEAMALKTVIRRLCKMLPRSTDRDGDDRLEKALDRDRDLVETTATDAPPAVETTAAGMTAALAANAEWEETPPADPVEVVAEPAPEPEPVAEIVETPEPAPVAGAGTIVEHMAEADVPPRLRKNVLAGLKALAEAENAAVFVAQPGWIELAAAVDAYPRVKAALIEAAKARMEAGQ